MIDALSILIGLVLTFLVVVVVHELGHFWAARLVGVKPEIFSVGFGRSIWSRMDRYGVRWQIAALPLGGYVRYVGDENAASLSSMPEGDPIPGSLRAASKSGQAIVVLAGPLANLVLTVALLTAVPMIGGVTAHPWQIETVSDEGIGMPLKPADELVRIGDVEITPETTLETVLAALGPSGDTDYLVRRNGLQTPLRGARPDLPLLGYVAPESPAEAAGLKAGDLVREIDGHEIVAWSELQARVGLSEGSDLTMLIERADKIEVAELAPRLQGGRWLIGVSAAPLFTLQRETPSPLTAVGLGLDRSRDLMTRTVAGIAASLAGSGDSCKLDGPIAISRAAGQALQLGPEIFLTFMAVISLGLGLLNLLPIPILDGGHLALLGMETLTGRQVSKRVQAVLFIVGVTAIVFLMLTATINDLKC